MADNYEMIGIPFIISLPESKLTYENVFEQISIYAKWVNSMSHTMIDLMDSVPF